MRDGADSGRSRTARRCVAALALALGALASPVHAQQKGGTPAPAAAADPGGHLAAARTATAAGDAAAARHHLLAALAVRPASPDVLGEFLRLDAADDDARLLWLVHAAAACGDATGRFSPTAVPPKTWPKLAPDEWAVAQKIAAARASAVAAIDEAAARLAGPQHVAAARWLERLAYAVEDGIPALAALHDAAFAGVRERVQPDRKAVRQGLLQLAQTSIATDPATALTAARIVRGILQQEGQTGTGGAPPTDEMRTAVDLIDRARAALRKDETAAAWGATESATLAPAAGHAHVWTLDDLTKIGDADVVRWNAEHVAWQSPGICWTASRRYRIETTCGLRTLTAVTKDADAIHDLLSGWFGKDPFGGVPGTIRICRSDADLECEGRPFWWAGGFQSEQTTTLGGRFGARGDFASALTHELTHRFDNAVRPGMPPWLMEGRAVYVQSCAVLEKVPRLDERLVDWSRLRYAGFFGYCNAQGLERLLRESMDDYRHNYSGGYALWTFLWRFRGFGPDFAVFPIFREKIPAYLASFKDAPGTDPIVRFTAAFCDAKGGRPATLSTVSDQFARFVVDLVTPYAPPDHAAPPWVQKFWIDPDQAARQAIRSDWTPPMFDGPAWDRRGDRADPPRSGESLARAAAELLRATDRKPLSLQAVRWALAADEPGEALFQWAAAFEAADGQTEAAWFDKAESRALGGAGPPAFPFPPDIAATALVGVRGLADVFALQADAADTRGRAHLADVFRAEHDRLVPFIPGRRTLATPEASGIALAPRTPAPVSPEIPAPRSLVTPGIVAARWGPGETTETLPWHVIDDETIELGRSANDAALSGVVRNAGGCRVGARSRVWLDGDYVVRTRVRFMSALADARLVVGRAGADRGVEIEVWGGDWYYAQGLRDGSFQLASVEMRVSDVRGWDERTAPVHVTNAFFPPREFFDLEVRVTGPFVRVFIDGRPVASLRRTTGAPVEGGVGFVLGQGIVRFEQPVAWRLRTSGPDRVSPGDSGDEPLALDRPGSFPFATIAGRRLTGVAPDPKGMLVFWHPEGGNSSTVPPKSSARAVNSMFREWLSGPSSRPALLVAVPAAEFKPEMEEPLRASLAGNGVDRTELRAHSGHSGLAVAVPVLKQELKASGDTAVEALPLWLAVDDTGVIRLAGAQPNSWRGVALFRAISGR